VTIVIIVNIQLKYNLSSNDVGKSVSNNFEINFVQIILQSDCVGYR